jgi:hypothetical protein
VSRPRAGPSSAWSGRPERCSPPTWSPIPSQAFACSRWAAGSASPRSC